MLFLHVPSSVAVMEFFPLVVLSDPPLCVRFRVSLPHVYTLLTCCVTMGSLGNVCVMYSRVVKRVTITDENDN